MKKKKTKSKKWLGAIMFFFTIAILFQIAILVYDYIIKRTADKTLIAVLMLALIVMLAIIATIIDAVRRKISVDKPVDKILKATEELSKGNYNYKIDIPKNYSNFNQYDVIMDNVNLLAENLKKSEVLKTDFISNVSHEIKTPITIINSYAYALKDSSLDDKTRQFYLDTLLSASKRLSGLVTDILKLNKLENDKTIIEMEKFSLSEILLLALVEFENIAEEKNLEIESNIEDLSIYSCKNLINVILNNLISNAVKFTNYGGKIFVSLSKENNFAIITIKDTGIGMTAEIGNKIFEKFYQGETSHSKEGNGLGLALVKKIIDVLGGEISVDSELFVGSTFTVKLKGVLDE